MWGSANDPVSCIACGDSVERSDAREYDKHGDRWDRDGKEFEHLCKPCFRDLTKHARDGLEDTLEAAGAGRVGDDEFLARFLAETTEEPPGRE
ncbi:DUF7562 family protein [Halobacterium litoreum]|uniref:Small CPxCG-related zinc finger protein n=1 Tax=Halobacterium litoreum TaxID=2039234 RepID=A0ABD5NFZ3_9EURY|nr:hypothetical protein [Halobacterium litoreum]UHH12992.1 hypothetical protein LT972_12620 [Halobacterium litoreum]